MKWTIECELDAIIHDAELAIQEICSNSGVGFECHGSLFLTARHVRSNWPYKARKEVNFVPF